MDRPNPVGPAGAHEAVDGEDGPGPRSGRDPSGSAKGDQTRRRLMRIIEASPGIHVSKLCRESMLSWGTIQYHLRWMAQEGRIQVHRTGRLLQIFPASAPPSSTWLGILRDAIPTQILASLNQSPGLGVQDLSRSLGVSRKTIRRHLTDLLEAGLVHREGGYRGQFLPRSDRDSQPDRP